MIFTAQHDELGEVNISVNDLDSFIKSELNDMMFVEYLNEDGDFVQTSVEKSSLSNFQILGWF